MFVSVIVRSKDEADRLKLTLAALSAQDVQAEVVVVNDGSSDHTRHVLSAARSMLPLVQVDHATPLGRSAASNAGAAVASGDILLFLDGDALAAPDLVARHLALHDSQAERVARGETWHLRQTRRFLDPATASPMAGEAERVSLMSAAERRASLITLTAILDDFGSIEARAQPGIYPGAGPRRLYDIEMDALRSAPKCPVLWAAASGQNLSVAREAFLDAGGFDPGLDLIEQRELALRLCRNGMLMAPVPGRSYHMTHRAGWRDPLADLAWMERFYGAHPIPAVALLRVLWSGLADATDIPESARIMSLPQLAAAAALIPPGLSAEEVVAEHLRLSATLEVSPARRPPPRSGGAPCRAALPAARVAPS